VVVDKQMSGLTLAPEDRAFSILENTMELAAFNLLQQDEEEATN
jgi:hypothetical protein